MLRRAVLQSALCAGAAALWSGRSRAESGLSLAVIVHVSNPIVRLSADELESIFRSSRRYWENGSAIISYNLPLKSDERSAFDRAVLRMDPDEVVRFWIDRRVRGESPPPRQAPDASIMLRLVSKLEGGVGYVPSTLVDTSVKVAARIENGKVVR
jgi:hypothetical protein